MAFPPGIVEALDDIGRFAIGHHPFRVLATPVLVVGDLPQRGYRIHRSSVPAWLEQLPDDEPGQNHAEAADLAGDELRHRHLGSPIGAFELVGGVAARTMADVTEDGPDEEEHD